MWKWGRAPWNSPAEVLRAVLGTLMLSSDPTGAAILINGKRQQQVTPAQIQLALGSYEVTVEWGDGKKLTRTVQINDSNMRREKFWVEK